QTSIEIIEYKGIDNKISLKSFPAITLCYEHTFENMLFDNYIRNYYENKFNISKIITNYSKYMPNKIKYPLNSSSLYIENLYKYYKIFNVIDQIERYNESCHSNYYPGSKSMCVYPAINSTQYVEILRKYFAVNTRKEFQQ